MSKRYFRRSRFTVEDEFRPVVNFIQDERSIETKMSEMTVKELESLATSLRGSIYCTKHTKAWKYLTKTLGDDYVVEAYKIYLVVNTDCKLQKIGAC